MRFTGSVEFLTEIDVSELVSWIAAIPLQEWPQQRQNELRPAMITDLTWHNFRAMSDPIVEATKLKGTVDYQRMLSTVMPGHSIEPHTDQQDEHWIARVHIPLMTNNESKFIVNHETYNLEIGRAYLVNTFREHSVTNDGDTPRIHFMYDMR